MLKSQAWVAFGCNDIRLSQVLVDDQLRDDEVLLRMNFSSVCHTDLYTLSGLDPEGRFPCILGHEGVGTVVKSTSSKFKAGDVCIPLYVPECSKCAFCKSNKKTNLCQAVRETQGLGLMPDRSTRFFLDSDKPVYHFMGCSCWSEYTVVLAISLVKIDPALPMELGPLIGCGVSTGIGAVRNTASIDKGSSVAIFGLGCVGLAALIESDRRGAKTIVAIDKDPERIEFIKKTFPLTCTDVHFLNATPESAHAQMARAAKLTPGDETGDATAGGDATGDGSVEKACDMATASTTPEHRVSTALKVSDGAEADRLASMVREVCEGGVDYSFDCTGNVTVMRAALECCHKGWGVCTLVGVAGLKEEISTRPFQFIVGRHLQGCAFGGFKGKTDLPALMHEMAQNIVSDSSCDDSESIDPMSMDMPLILQNEPRQRTVAAEQLSHSSSNLDAESAASSSPTGVVNQAHHALVHPHKLHPHHHHHHHHHTSSLPFPIKGFVTETVDFTDLPRAISHAKQGGNHLRSIVAFN